jgi:hypothetical protein
MALGDNNELLDNRTPVIFRGIKEETLAFNRSQSLEDTLQELRDAGASVSRAEVLTKEDSLQKEIEKNQEEIRTVLDRTEAAKKATGTVTVVTSSIVVIPKGTSFFTVGGKEFVSTKAVETTDTGLNFRVSRASIPVESVSGGSEYNVPPNTIRRSDNSIIDSVTNTEATSGGEDEVPLSDTENRIIDSSVEDIQESREALGNVQDDIGELNELGRFTEGEFTVTLLYDQPNVSVSTTNRFVEHETIDGPVIRQKIGRGQKTISLEGVCTTPEATLLDNFINEDQIFVKSHRYEGEVTIESVSTNPLEDGGAINLEGNFTHEFGLELIEIE